MTRPQVVDLPERMPPEFRLAEALRDLIGGVLAELPSPAPALSEVRRALALQQSAEMAMHVQLTDREGEVLALVARGLDTVEIGARTYLAVRTVKSYVAMAIAKLNATNRAHAVAIAFRMGFIDPTLDELLGMDTTDKEGETRP